MSMKLPTVGHYKEIDNVRMDHSDLKDTAMRRLIGPEHGWDGYAMRLFTVDPGGYTPKHILIGLISIWCSRVWVLC